MRARIVWSSARHLGGGRSVARIVLGGEPVLAARGLELILLPRTPARRRSARATRRASRARARSCSSGCRGRPGPRRGSRRPPDRDGRRRMASLPWRKARPAAQPPAVSASREHQAKQSEACRHVAPLTILRAESSAVRGRRDSSSRSTRRRSRTMRYCPSMISPSFPYTGLRCWPLPSLSTAIVLPPALHDADELQRDRRQRGGAGGGRSAAGGSGGVAATGGSAGGGGACGLNRNRLRIVPSGFGRSASSASRCTSGAVTSAACRGACQRLWH